MICLLSDGEVKVKERIMNLSSSTASDHDSRNGLKFQRLINLNEPL